MTPTEKLARKICFAEFAVRPKCYTEASYWRIIHADRRAQYIEDARWFFWMMKRLGHDTVSDLLKLHDHIRKKETA